MKRVIALCGNQNAGKTTLFNLLTGDTQRVGNWPGVTVERRSGDLLARFSGGEQVECVDLPGIYSLTPYTPEETVAYNFILREKPDVIINIVDATSLQRGLYLTLELMSLGRPMALAVNMMDALRNGGGTLDFARLSGALGVPVSGICARTGENVPQLISIALAQARVPQPLFPFHAQIESLALHAQQAAARYQWIDRITEKVLKMPAAAAASPFDRLLTGKFSAYPLLLLTLLLVLLCAFGAPGQSLSALLSGLIGQGIAQVDALLQSAGTAPLLRSLIVDGALGGISAVMAFLPPILLMFLLLGILEDSGFMARAAFILDTPMRRLGLSGRSFLPLATGFGCTVPAILALRTLNRPDEQRRAARLIPLIPCGAKAPVYLYLTAAYFPAAGLLLPLALYAAGIAAMLLCAFLLRQGKGHESTPFLMELPAWRAPTWGGLKRVLRDKIRDFLTRAFTVVFLSSLVLWAFQSFTPRLSIAASPDQSLLYALGRLITPLFAPLGFGSAPAVAALVAGIFAKENIISTLSLTNASFTPAAALSFGVFGALYAPCIAAQAVIHRELKSRGRMLLSMLSQSALAWLAALIVYRVMLLL